LLLFFVFVFCFLGLSGPRCCSNRGIASNTPEMGRFSTSDVVPSGDPKTTPRGVVFWGPGTPPGGVPPDPPGTPPRCSLV
jgi:hypothetical protein